MGDLLGCIDATPFGRSRSTVARVSDRMVTLAVASSLVMSTFILAAALAGPISRSSAPAATRIQSANSAAHDSPAAAHGRAFRVAAIRELLTGFSD
jgi:hypothetical protein